MKNCFSLCVVGFPWPSVLTEVCWASFVAQSIVSVEVLVVPE